MTLLPTPSSTAVCKELEDGAVLFCTRTEVYFGLNAVGRLIWDSLPPVTRTVEELGQQLVDRFPGIPLQTLMEDVDAFLAALTEAGLVTPSSPESHPA